MEGNCEYDFKCEIYCVGWLLYCVHIQTFVVQDKDDDRPLQLDWTDGNKPDCCESVLAAHLIKMMTSNDPRKRSHFVELLDHPMFWEWSKYLEFLTTVNDTIRAELDRNKSEYSACKIRLEFEIGKANVLPGLDNRIGYGC